MWRLKLNIAVLVKDGASVNQMFLYQIYRRINKIGGLCMEILGVIIFAVIFFLLLAGVYYSAAKECKK